MEDITKFNDNIPTYDKILLIYTGGTIGMTKSKISNSYSPDPLYLID